MKKKIYVFILILIGMTIIFSSKVHAINREIDGNFATDGSTIRIFEGQELKIDYKSTWDNNDGTIAMKIKNNTYYNGYIRDSNNKKQWTEKHYYEDSNFKVELKNYTQKKVEISGITYRNYKDIYFYGKKATSEPVKITIISETGKKQQLNIEILAPISLKVYENTEEGKFEETIDLQKELSKFGIAWKDNFYKEVSGEEKSVYGTSEKNGSTYYECFKYDHYNAYVMNHYIRFSGKTKRRIKRKYYFK